jgi:hypothetical protein
MKATFVAPDVTVLAQVLSASSSKEELLDGVKEIIEGEDREKKIKEVVSNPSNLRFAWIRVEKNEENLDFISALLLLSANNNYSIATKDVIFTNTSAFINVNLLEAYKTVSDTEVANEIRLEDKIDDEKVMSLTENLFDTPQFMELYSSEEDGPEMFMLSGTMSVDTWSMLSTIGIVSTRNFGQLTGDGTEKVPGMCLLFGLAMTTLMHILKNADKMPKHISEDINRLPRAKKEEEDETN